MRYRREVDLAGKNYITISLDPNGVLNFARTFDNFKPGEMSYGRNTRVQNDEFNNTVNRKLIKGTRDTFDFAPEDAITQNAVFRVYFDLTYFPSASYSLFVNNPNNYNFDVILVGGSVNTSDINLCLADFVANLTFDMALYGQTITNVTSTVTSTTEGYVDFEMTTINYWDYTAKAITGNCLKHVEKIQSGIDESQIGDWMPLCGKDLHGDLFSLWTTVKDLPTEVPIVGGMNDGSGGYLITFVAPFTYVNNGLLELKGTPIDGQWIVQIITSTTLRVLGTTYTADFTGGIVVFYPKSLSEIGVATRDNQTLLWSYIRLARTDQWNLRAVKQPEIGGAEDNIFRKSFYFNDHYNPDRVFYYYGAYVTDGAFTINNPQAIYNYSTIGQETKLIQNNQDAKITYIGQADSGGGLTSGTYRYSGRFLSDDKTPTGLYLETTGQINVYSSAGNPSTIGGDEAGSPTGKVNNLVVTFDADLFRYFELIAIYYTGGAQSATLVSRVEISNGQTSLNISHSGLEPNSEAFDAGAILTSSTIYDICKSLTIVDNFLVRSNMKTSSKQYDLSGFFKTFEHTIWSQPIGQIGTVITPGSPLKIGEYQIPLNMESNGGFMLFECYRLMAKVRYKDGAYSPLFWVDDIKIDFNAYNITNAPTNPNFTNRRVGNLLSSTGYNLNTGANTYVPFLYFSGYDLNYIIEGIPISELIDEIIIERAEVVREVLSSGITVMGVSGQEGVIPIFLKFNYNLTSTAADIGFFPFSVGNNLSPFATNPIYPSAFTEERRWGAYYTADGIFQDYHSVLPNDQLISLGSTINTTQSIIPSGAAPFDIIDEAEYREFTAVTNSPNFNTVTIDDGGLVVDSETFTGITVTNTVTYAPVGADLVFINQPCLALHFTSDLDNVVGTGTDYGVYQTYYYRGISVYDAAYNPDTSKYGNRSQSRGVTICERIDTSVLSGVVGVGDTRGAFGQDVFTQGTFIKLRAPYKLATSGFTVIQDADEHTGYGGGMLFYSQNLVNSQMVFKDTPDDFNTWNFPNVSFHEWFYWWKGFQDSVPYDQSYGYINKPNTDVMYDGQTIVSVLPATYFYSSRKPLNSFIDPYRQFFPFNFVDEDLSNGEIVSHVVFNGRIYGLQPLSVRRRFLNSNATLQPSNTGAEIIVGDGNVMARVSEEISNIGCTHKFGVLIGRSQGGNDVLYWPNLNLKCIVRLGLDGTVPISFIQGIQPFIKSNTKWIVGKDMPAAGEGINCVWYDSCKEAIFTGKGYAVTSDEGGYDAGTAYVYLDEVTFDSSQYIALEAVEGEDPDTSAKWVKILNEDGSFTDEYLLNFTNIWTLVFSEIQNGFINQDRDYHPNVYMDYKDTYLSSGYDPDPAATGMYEHEVGVRGKFYGVQYDGQDEWVVSQPFNNAKRVSAFRFRTKVTPKRVDFSTNIINSTTSLPQVSYLNDTDFTFRDGFYDAPLHGDSSVTTQNPSGLNTVWAFPANGMLYGDYLKMKLTYEGASDQEVNNIVIKERILPRENNK